MPTSETDKLLQSANACLEENRLADACRLYTELCRKDPRNSEAWMMLGALHGETGNLQEAVRCLQQSIQLDPTQGESHNILARIMAATGRLEEAVTCFRRAVQAEPEDGELWTLISGLEGQLGRYRLAAEAGRKAVRLLPDSTEAHMNLAQALGELEDLRGAAEHYLSATRLQPELVDAWVRLAATHNRMGQIDLALSEYQTVLGLQPDHLDSIAGRARMLELKGDFDDAWRSILPNIEAGTYSVAMALLFASLSKRYNRQGDAARLLENILSSGRPTPAEQVNLHFALGKLLDAAGDYDSAFTHFSKANALKSVTVFDIDRHRHLFDTLRNTYTTDFVHSMPRAAISTELPVFIVGMPRSGTTLVEQILASHPDVFGAGELWDIAEIADTLPDVTGDDRPYPLSVPAINVVTATKLAGHYIDRIRQLGGEQATRITDKMPHNFLHLGLISQLFPGAHIIHCIRDPLDTCLSCYFSDFQMKHEYSNDLSSLGAYYGMYEELMAHWKSVLDIPILDVHYEQLISRQEEISRDVVAFCGLPWDEHCLRFHETERTVTTLSHDQVRTPLYTSSTGRWKNYETCLGPLKESLAGAGPSD